TIPRSLTEATARFSKSDFVKKAFGKQVQAHYSHHFKMEQAAYEKAVTDWERKRYFERI
ncbi:MAG: glutamine synthetase, partial [Paraglaciecola sp.]